MSTKEDVIAYVNAISRSYHSKDTVAAFLPCGTGALVGTIVLSSSSKKMALYAMHEAYHAAFRLAEDAKFTSYGINVSGGFEEFVIRAGEYITEQVWKGLRKLGYRISI